MLSFHFAIIALAIFDFAHAICYDTETSALTCYKPPNGTKQNVKTADVQYAAAYLREYGATAPAGQLLKMAAEKTPKCAEYSLYQHGTVLVLAKHITYNINSSVLFSDIANTIDGGENASSSQQKAAILGCSTYGGSDGVHVSKNPVYNSASYPEHYQTKGIIIKIVNPTPQS